MSTKLWCFIKDSKLYGICSRLYIYHIRTPKLVHSILKCDIHESTVKYEDGEIATINFATQTDISKVDIDLYDKIYTRPEPKFTVIVECGFLKIDKYYVTGEISLKIERAEYGDNDIIVWYKGGEIERYSMAEFLLFSCWESTSRYYCLNGELAEVEGKLVLHPRNDGTDNVVVEDAAGNFYYFHQFIGKLRRLFCRDRIALYVGQDGVLPGIKMGIRTLPKGVIWDIHPILGMPYVVGGESFMRHPNTVKLIQKGTTVTAENESGTIGTILSNYVTSNFITARNIIFLNRKDILCGHIIYDWLDKVYFAEGKLFDIYANEVRTTKINNYPFLINKFTKIFKIYKHGGVFIINKDTLILSIPDIINVEVGDCNLLIITTKTKIMRGFLIDVYAFYFIPEDTSQPSFPLINADGPHYCEYGELQKMVKYERVPGFTNAYILDSNYVMFECNNFNEIFCLHGTYVGIYNRIWNNLLSAHGRVGLITIYKPSSRIKAAPRINE